MRVEAILSVADLMALAAQFMPFSVELGGEGSLVVTDPSDLTLLAGNGVRVVCKAKLKWPVLGIVVPVTVQSLALVVQPEIAKTTDGEALLLKLEVEHADLAGVPTFVDKRITEKVNAALAEKHVELAWNFAGTLNHAFALPKSLAPLEAFALSVIGARVVVTAEAMGFSVAFQSSVTRSPAPSQIDVQ